ADQLRHFLMSKGDFNAYCVLGGLAIGRPRQQPASLSHANETGPANRSSRKRSGSSSPWFCRKHRKSSRLIKSRTRLECLRREFVEFTGTVASSPRTLPPGQWAGSGSCRRVRWRGGGQRDPARANEVEAAQGLPFHKQYSALWATSGVLDSLPILQSRFGRSQKKPASRSLQIRQ